LRSPVCDERGERDGLLMIYLAAINKDLMDWITVDFSRTTDGAVIDTRGWNVALGSLLDPSLGRKIEDIEGRIVYTTIG
jgi:hypothetical protein